MTVSRVRTCPLGADRAVLGLAGFPGQNRAVECSHNPRLILGMHDVLDKSRNGRRHQCLAKSQDAACLVRDMTGRAGVGLVQHKAADGCQTLGGTQLRFLVGQNKQELLAAAGFAMQGAVGGVHLIVGESKCHLAHNGRGKLGYCLLIQ